MKLSIEKLSINLKQTKYLSNKMMKLLNNKNTREQNRIIVNSLEHLFQLESNILELRVLISPGLENSDDK